jgi:hypothetical protein
VEVRRQSGTATALWILLGISGLPIQSGVALRLPPHSKMSLQQPASASASAVEMPRVSKVITGMGFRAAVLGSVRTYARGE